MECTTTVIGGTGAGLITLRRYNGLPMPSDIWGIADIDVDYTISDTTTNPAVPKLEKGLGVITTGTSLTRSRPRLTWDGTTFDEDLPAALNFGAAPALGNVRIRIAPTSDMFIQGPPSIIPTSYVTAFSGFLPTSTLCGAPGTTSWVELAAGWQYYIPYLCGARGTVTGMGAYCAEVVGADNFYLGIYGVHPTDGTPGRCITQSGPILQSGIGLLKDITPAGWQVRPGPVSLKQGWYYIGFLSPLVPFRMAVSSRNQLAGPSPMGVYDQFGWGAIMRRNAGGAETVLPPVRPGGAYGNPASLITAMNVPTVMLGFAN